jgi:nitrogen-specific signal transduction histidine kinase
LIVIKGADEGKQFELTGDSAGVGRDAANRIRLCDTEASRRHAEFVPSPDGYRILDVGSANGTFVNNQSIRDVLLRPGDQVRVGQTVLVFSAGRTADAPPGDLADQISLITRQDLELSSAVVKTIGEGEGSRILARPEQQGPWLKNALANLSVMYETTQAISHILDLDQLLSRIMELIFKSLDADRGCILLRPAGGGDDAGELNSANLEPQAVRWRDLATRHEKLPVSRTVIDYVLREKKGVLVSDATRDERFQAVQSIVRFGVREVICVPMKGRHETVGVLYLDSRTPMREAIAAGNASGKFTSDHLALAAAIAHQAALAVEETRYHQALVQAERLAAVGQTIAALSHHIKNILQGLHIGGKLLKSGIDDKDEPSLRKGWTIVEKNQGKIYDLVMDMLSYSKEREPALEDADLNAVARDVVELLAPRAKELGVSLTMRLDKTLPTCPADKEGIHRALLNIVGNALDAVEGVESPQVTVTTVKEPGALWVRIDVNDNGAGVPTDKLADIFRPFVSTKGAKGTGLGLAVSRKILREHGGDITARSQPGKGSVFALRLPLRGAPGQEIANTRTDIPVAPA